MGGHDRRVSASAQLLKIGSLQHSAVERLLWDGGIVIMRNSGDLHFTCSCLHARIGSGGACFGESDAVVMLVQIAEKPPLLQRRWC